MTNTVSHQRRRLLLGLTAMGMLNAMPVKASTRKVDNPKIDLSTGKLVDIGGRRLWVDDSGPRNAPTLLYVHGGPGVGSLEFETYMKPALANRVRLISVDQRGVLRSDPIAKDATVTAADIVADFEALRRKLGIPRWQVLGHSFGGHLALRYALQYPKQVSRLTLENPGYDVPSAFHWLAASGAQLLNGTHPEAALAASKLAQHSTPVDSQFVDSIGKTLAVLGQHRQDLYVVQDRNRDMFSRLAATAGLPDERWEQGQVPGMALLRASDFLAPMTDRVSEVKVPMLLIRGSGDHATSPEEIAALLAAGARLETVDDAGHFIHVEEPTKFADLIVG